MSGYDEQRLDAGIAEAFGLRAVPASHASTGGAMDGAALLQRFGMPADQARASARLVAQGVFGSLEEAALQFVAMTPFDNSNRPSMNLAGLREALRRRGGPGSVLQERRSVSQTRPRIIEAGRAKVAEGRLSVCLIDAGQGSSGYYPAATLQEAARAKVFSAGLHCYLDHPSYSDAMDRPERSVRDLAGALSSDAVFRDGGLYAEARVFASYTEFVTERADAIGMSIRAQAVVEAGEADGAWRASVVREITHAESVDFVTQAGRGGRIVSYS